ncbi:Tfx family DNA-binding protein [Candidatus Bipolaricaulota bacterium]|nr:Tfx family DNA-binding protein [Candidatus Bipolaricaulota bacterium]
MKAKNTILTKKQMEILKLRSEGYTQQEIADKLETTRQNVSAIERTARENIKKAENTLKFVRLLEAPIWFTAKKGMDLDEIMEKIFSQADKENIHVVYDGIFLAMKIREEAAHRMIHRVVVEKFNVGITKDGEIIVV